MFKSAWDMAQEVCGLQHFFELILMITLLLIVQDQTTLERSKSVVNTRLSKRTCRDRNQIDVSAHKCRESPLTDCSCAALGIFLSVSDMSSVIIQKEEYRSSLGRKHRLIGLDSWRLM